MNSNVMPSRVQMESSHLQQLVAEVKETIATGIEVKQVNSAHSFRAINFWNLRRRQKLVNGGSNRKKSVSLSLSHVSF